jgi:hypothetical protein
MLRVHNRYMMLSSLVFALAATSATSAIVVQRGTLDVHLAVSPKCGTLSGSPADVNAGLRLSTYNTVVSFGVRIDLFAWIVYKS